MQNVTQIDEEYISGVLHHIKDRCVSHIDYNKEHDHRSRHHKDREAFANNRCKQGLQDAKDRKRNNDHKGNKSNDTTGNQRLDENIMEMRELLLAPIVRMNFVGKRVGTITKDWLFQEI